MPTLKWTFLACMLLMPMTVIGQNAPNVTLDLADISPADGTTLPLYTQVHGRIVYQTDQPVRLELRPYRNGRPVLEGVYYSGSPEYPAPGGAGIAWFAFSEPQTIDEIRASASDVWGNSFTEVTLSRRLVWQPNAPAPAVAAWVEPLKQQTDALSRAQQPPSDDGFLVMLLVQLVFLLVPLSVILQLVSLLVLKGRPKAVAWLSAMAMALLWAFVIVTAVAGSNLSPIWLVFLSPLFVLLLGSLLVGRWLTRTPAT